MQTADYVLWTFSKNSPSSAEDILRLLRSWDESFGDLLWPKPKMAFLVPLARLLGRFSPETLAAAIKTLVEAGYIAPANQSFLPQDKPHWSITQAGKDRVRAL